MANLDCDMRSTPDMDTQCEILRHLWDCDSKKFQEGIAAGDINLTAYFKYYTEQCTLALYDNGYHILARAHRDIVDIADRFREHSSRDDIFQALKWRNRIKKLANGDEMINGSINLAARLLVMVNIGNFVFGYTGRRHIDWQKDSLKGFLGELFDKKKSVMIEEHVKLEKTFNARNLGRIAGIEIVWTNNLADHLRMTDEDKKVAIFHYVFFLECQHGFLFPEGFIEEALRTLALLFPQSDKKTRKWLKKTCPLYDIDPCLMRCGQLRADDRHIGNFKYWHDRLVMLKQAFDEAQPSTLSRWWWDRRRGVQWYTFWVAVLVLVLTILFGLVQSIEGALQVYKAFRPT